MKPVVAFQFDAIETVCLGKKRFGRFRRAALYAYQDIHFGCMAYIETHSFLGTDTAYYGTLEAAETAWQQLDAGNLSQLRGDRHAPGDDVSDVILW